MDDATPFRSARARTACLAILLAFLQAPGCRSTFIGTTASSYMRTIRENPDPNDRYLAFGKLGSSHCYDREEQKSEAVQLLIETMETDREPVASRALICRTLGALGDRSARTTLIKAVEDPEPIVRSEACRALGKVGEPEDATLLIRIMTVDTLGDCRVAAIEGLADLKAPDPRINAHLVEGMEHGDPAIRLASLQALRAITGKDLGIEAGPWREELRESSTVVR